MESKSKVKKIKLAVLSTFWPFGGISNHVENIYSQLSKDPDLEITLITNYQNKKEKAYLLKRFKTVKKKVFYTPRIRFLRGLFYILRTYCESFRDYDLIKIHNTTYALVFLPKLFFSGKEFIINTHGKDVNELLNNPVYKFLAKIVYKKAKLIICPSKNEKNKITELGISQNKIKTIRDGVEIAKFNVKRSNYLRKMLGIKNKIILTFVGHISYIKGTPELIKATSKIMQEDVAMVLVGNVGGKGKELIGEIKELEKKYPNRFFWIGEREDISKILNSSDIFLLPSLSEASTSISLLEAMAAGNACIATDVGDIKDLLKDSVLIIPPGKEEEIAEAVKKLVKTPKLMIELREKSLKTISNFDWVKIAKEHNGILKSQLK